MDTQLKGVVIGGILATSGTLISPFLKILVSNIGKLYINDYCANIKFYKDDGNYYKMSKVKDADKCKCVFTVYLCNTTSTKKFIKKLDIIIKDKDDRIVDSILLSANIQLEEKNSLYFSKEETYYDEDVKMFKQDLDIFIRIEKPNGKTQEKLIKKYKYTK